VDVGDQVEGGGLSGYVLSFSYSLSGSNLPLSGFLLGMGWNGAGGLTYWNHYGSQVQGTSIDILHITGLLTLLFFNSHRGISSLYTLLLSAKGVCG